MDGGDRAIGHACMIDAEGHKAFSGGAIADSCTDTRRQSDARPAGPFWRDRQCGSTPRLSPYPKPYIALVPGLYHGWRGRRVVAAWFRTGSVGGKSSKIAMPECASGWCRMLAVNTVVDSPPRRALWASIRSAWGTGQLPRSPNRPGARGEMYHIRIRPIYYCNHAERLSARSALNCPEPCNNRHDLTARPLTGTTLESRPGPECGRYRWPANARIRRWSA